MERFSFAPDMAFVPQGDLLDRVTVAPLTAPLSEGALIQAAIFRFEPGGRLRRHPAGPFPQIFAVLEGLGEVSGADGVDEEIQAGEAVFWHPAEEHGTKSQFGLTALIIEVRVWIGSEGTRQLRLEPIFPPDGLKGPSRTLAQARFASRKRVAGIRPRHA